MPIKVEKLIHIGIRVDPEDDAIKVASEFYSGLLGFEIDGEQPEIPNIPGFWFNLSPGDRGQQLHAIGARGASPASRSEKHDPTRSHMAFTVADIDAAREELNSRAVDFW